MDRGIEQVIKVDKVNRAYKMGNKQLKIICYADEISTTKTNSMVIAREPHRCKLELNNKTIDQVSEFIYLEIKISADDELKNGVRKQVNKAARIAGALQTTIWKSRCISILTKVRIQGGPVLNVNNPLSIVHQT